MQEKERNHRRPNDIIRNPDLIGIRADSLVGLASSQATPFWVSFDPLRSEPIVPLIA